MKKILIFTNVVTLLLLGATWLSGCGDSTNPNTNQEIGPATTTSITPEPAKLSYTQDNPNFPIEKGELPVADLPTSPPVCLNYNAPDPTVNDYRILSGNAVEMVSIYSTDHWKKINNGNTNDVKDTRSVWFSLTRLKGFIQYIEGRAANIGIDQCCDTLGVRIYFAEYDEFLQNKFFPDAPNYRYKTTLLMVPTLGHTTPPVGSTPGYHANYDFNPDFYTGTKIFHCETFMNDSAWSSSTMVALAMNHGGAVPPPWPSNNCPDYAKCGATFMLTKIDPYGTNNPFFYITPSVTCEDTQP